MRELKVENGKIINKQRNRKGDFNCSCCNFLTTLENCPNKVGGGFYCNHNKLTTLEYSPKEVGGEFYCYRNDLITLEGSPEKVGGDFKCCYNKLTTLKGCPKVVGGDFDCSGNIDLEDISDLPSMVCNLYIEECPNIRVFTKEITNKEGLLRFFISRDYDTYKGKELYQRIKSWPYYEVVDEHKVMYGDFILTVSIKSDNELFMNEL